MSEKGKWECMADQSEFPSSSGCYAIYCDGELCYIGSSKNLKRRLINGHLESFFYNLRLGEWLLPWWNITRCKDLLIKCSKSNDGWLEREKKLIRRLNPKANRKYKTVQT